MPLLKGGVAILAGLVVAIATDGEGDVDGQPGCRCLGTIPSSTAQEFGCNVEWAKEGTCVNVDQAYATPGFPTVYSSTYGKKCEAHAEPKLDSCSTSNGTALPSDQQASYCNTPWCYVDPCYCNLADATPSSAFPGKLYYSFLTCGSVDEFTENNTDNTVGDANCDPDKGFTDDRDACVDPLAGGAYELHLPYPSHNMTITIPEIPIDTNMYSYASEKAMVAIPTKCANMFPGAANFVDRPPEGPTGMYYMRMSDPAQYEMLARIGESHCAAGLVLLIHGTSGARWQSVSYAAMVSGMGYVAVMLDSHAMPDEMGLKGAKALKSTDELDLSNYCGAMDAYASRCSSWGKTDAKPFCYSTKVENILNHRVNYKRFVERNYLIRKHEIDYFVEHHQPVLDSFTKVFLLGRSEGGMVSSRYYHPMLFNKLTGMILSGTSCEFNYFVSCAENAKICGGVCNKSLPILNVNGDLDNYFGATDSVSSKVSASVNGYGANPITGNCNKAFQTQGFRYGTTVYFPPAKHGIMYSHDNALRSVFADFMAHPKNPSVWHSVERDGCTYLEGIITCDALLGAKGESPCVGYKVNPNATWVNLGSTEQYPKTCADAKAMYKANQCCGQPEKTLTESW